MSTWQATVARERWRGDLLEYAAAQLRTIGWNDQADAKDAEAELHRAQADSIEEYETTIASVERDGAEFNAAQAKLAAFRAHWRGIREFVGQPMASVVNNFPEPTDDELLEAQP